MVLYFSCSIIFMVNHTTMGFPVINSKHNCTADFHTKQTILHRDKQCNFLLISGDILSLIQEKKTTLALENFRWYFRDL